MLSYRLSGAPSAEPASNAAQIRVDYEYVP